MDEELPSGTSASGDHSFETVAPLARVHRVLNRDVPIDSLAELSRCVSSSGFSSNVPEGSFAIGFDTNAIFRLGLGRRGPDAVDYLVKSHIGPVIVPGQTIQEVWNNSLAAVLPQAKVVQKKFLELEQEMLKVDIHLGQEGAAAREAINDLIALRGDWLDPSALITFETTLQSLLGAGHAPYVPREEFAPLARIRRDTKTPPGFEDTHGFGDFFVWADFLLGVATQSETFDHVVFVTNDTKKDWSRNGIPHPILVAEARAVAGVPFTLWTLPQFQDYAYSVIDSGDEESATPVIEAT